MTLFSRPVRGCLWQKTAPGNKTQLHSAPNFFLDQSVPKLGTVYDPPWADNPRPDLGTPPGDRRPQSLWQAYQLAEQWCWDRWRELDGGPPIPHHPTNPDPGGSWKPEPMPYKKAALRLHSGLPKTHNSLLTQIRTGKIGLASFLHRCWVPGFKPPGVRPRVGSGRQQSMSCWTVPVPLGNACDYTRQLPLLTSSGSHPRAAAALTKWFLRLNLLPSSPGPMSSSPLPDRSTVPFLVLQFLGRPVPD